MEFDAFFYNRIKEQLLFFDSQKNKNGDFFFLFLVTCF